LLSTAECLAGFCDCNVVFREKIWLNYSMKDILEKLKKRWGISGTGQVLVILAVFAITGFSFLYVNRFIDDLLGMSENTPFWLKALVFVVILLPVYNLLLLAWGTLFGQYRFFSNFIKQFFFRLFFRKKNK